MLVNLKKYQVFIFLILVLGTLVLLRLVVKPEPAKPPPSPTPKLSLSPVPEAPKSLKYLFEGALPEFAQKGATYQIVSEPVVSQDEARILAASFGLTDEPRVSQDVRRGSFYSWTGQDRYFSVGGKPPIISFGLSSFTNISTGAAALSTKTAASAAQEILNKKGLVKPTIDFTNPVFAYFRLRAGNLEETRSPETAQVVRVSYNYLLDSFVLLDSTPTSAPISLFLGPGEELLRLIYTKYPDGLGVVEGIDFLSASQAFKKLENQEGIIVHLLSEEDVNLEVPLIYRLASAKIKRVFLAYYYPPAPETQVLPIFVFEGETEDQTGKIVKIMVYLPAVK